jgi:2-isopropylmalate synthase
MSPADVGVPQTTLVLGKHSGRHAVHCRCEELGVKLERHELDRVYRAVIAHADREKIVNDADLLKIVAVVRSPAEPTEGEAPVYPPALNEFAATPGEKGYGHGV